MKKTSQANSARPPFLLRAARSKPHLYSAICEARLFYSQRVAGAGMRELFRSNQSRFAMSEFERTQVRLLQERGYALIPEFFSQAM